MVPRSAEECRVVPGRGGADIGEPLNYSTTGKGWGRQWGAFKLLYYHCNTTKIDRVEQPRTVCGAEECRADIGVSLKLPLNNSTTIEIPLKWKGSSSRGRLVVPRTAEWDRLVPGGGGEIPLQ